MADELLVESGESVRIITFNRPEQRNSLPPDGWLRLRDALDEIARDTAARVVVLRGAGGRAFSSGYDIGALQQLEQRGVVLGTSLDPFEIALVALVSHPLPTIAMVGGFAVGGGCTLAAGCDLRIAGEGARFGMPPAKLGLVYSATEMKPFLELLGPARTKLFFYSGRLVDARRAFELGLVDEVVPDAELERHTLSLAAEIADNAPLSVRGTKRILHLMGGQTGWPDTADEIDSLVQRVNTSADLAEGIRAFQEKRPPEFRGA